MSAEVINSMQPKKGRMCGEDGHQYVLFRMKMEPRKSWMPSSNDVLGLILESAIDKVRIAVVDKKE